MQSVITFTPSLIIYRDSIDPFMHHAVIVYSLSPNVRIYHFIVVKDVVADVITYIVLLHTQCRIRDVVFDIKKVRSWLYFINVTQMSGTHDSLAARGTPRLYTMVMILHSILC